MSREAWRAAVGYVAVFALLAAPWLRIAGHGEPQPPGWISPDDERLITWALAWVAHALGTDPRHLFDANIFHPAPGQLTGSDYYGSNEIVFAPVFWVTGNAVLAANLVAFLSYPLAALAMDRLLAALGCAAVASWVTGLFFALGPLRVPANLHVLQVANLYLPLIALAVTRLRTRPTGRRAIWLALAATASAFASYYVAVMAAFTGAVWAAFELLRPRSGRFRFAALGTAAAAVPAALLALASRPYLERPEAGEPQGLLAASCALGDWNRFGLLHGVPTFCGVLPLALAALGLLALGSRVRGVAVTARRGLAVALVAGVMILGQVQCVGGWKIPLPFAVIALSPVRFFRLPGRFIAVAGFGIALLTAAALAAAGARLGHRGRVLPAAAAALALLATRGRSLPGTVVDSFAAAGTPIYDIVHAVAREQGAGALLELPLIDAGGHRTEPDMMVGSTRHWLPLLTGYTGYWPPHRQLILNVIRRLPDADALADLVDMTGLRWLLLHPAAEWRDPAVRQALLAADGVTPVATREGWVMARVEVAGRHPRWLAALAAGWRPGFSLLGTPLARLPPDAAVAVVTASALHPRVRSSALVPLELWVRNAGTAPWPVSMRDGVPVAMAVDLVARWRSLDGADGDAETPAQIALPRDVMPGETVRVRVWLPAPSTAGAYRLEIGAEQIDGARFDGPGNVPLRSEVRVAGEDSGAG